MDTQSLAKLPFNLKIIPTTQEGIPFGVPFIVMFNPESLKSFAAPKRKLNQAG